MYCTEASRRNQWEGGIEKETERKLRGLRELREEGCRSRESGSEFTSFARLREAGSRSAERFGPAKREDLKAREPGSLHEVWVVAVSRVGDHVGSARHRDPGVMISSNTGVRGTKSLLTFDIHPGSLSNLEVRHQ